MPLRKFDDSDFDSLVRAKFDGAPQVPYDSKAWSKLQAKRGGAPWKIWVGGVTVVLLLIAALWIWKPFSPATKDKTDQISLNEPIGEVSRDSFVKKDEGIITRTNDGVEPAGVASKKVSPNENYEDQTSTELVAVAGESTDQEPKKQSSIRRAQLINMDGQSFQIKHDENGKVNVQEGVDSSSFISSADNPKDEAVNFAKTSVTEKERLVAEELTDSDTADKDPFVKVGQQNEVTNTASNVAQLSDTSKIDVGNKPLEQNTATSEEKNEIAVGKADDEKGQLAALPADERNGEKDGTSGNEISATPVAENGKEVKQNSDSSAVSGPATEEPIVQSKVSPANRFAVSLLVNTDLSTVKFEDFTKPGLGVGIRASYRFTNRLSISAGYTKTQRIYDVRDREDYTLPAWLLARQGWPEGVAARCSITEIPISIRYDLVRGSDWNIYGQLSTSSFMMDREVYDFESSQYGGDDIRRWEVEGVNKHYFGVVGTTIGYEKYFTRRWGVGVEFYWQTTLSGIGIYKVGLNSLGNQLMLNYRL